MPDTPEQRIADAIWDELREQEVYVSPEDGMIDASGSAGVNMNAVAHAVTTALGLTPEYTWTWPQSAGPGYGYPVDTIQEAHLEGPGLDIVKRYVTTPWRGVEEEQQ